MADPRQGLAGLLLAAGASTRLGRPKQLLDVDGVPLVCRQARLLSAACASVSVVTGAGAEAVEAALAGLPVECLRNPRWQDGMGASLAHGVAHLGRARAVLVLLVDQWALQADDLEALVAAWAQDPSCTVAASWPGCAAGVPAIFPAARFPALAALGGEQGARGLLASGAFAVRTLALPRAGSDLDTAADLAALAQSPADRNSRRNR